MSAAYNNCRSNTDVGAGDDVSGLMACDQAEIRVQDAALNTNYQKLLASAPSDADRESIRDGERKWIKARDAECSSQAADDQNPSSQDFTRADCLLTQEAQRNADLKTKLSATATAGN